MTEFTEIERDALKETANVGAGHAAISLSAIISRKVDLVVSDIQFMSMSNIVDAIAGPKAMVVGMYTPIVKGMSGNIVIMLNLPSALFLANSIQPGSAQNVMTEPAKKTLTRVGDILAGSYVTALNEFLQLGLEYQNTNIVTTFGESIVDIILLSVDANAQDALIIKTNFSIDGTDIKGEFILLLAITSIETLLSTIRSKLS